jgi:hypothetical protein
MHDWESARKENLFPQTISSSYAFSSLTVVEDAAAVSVVCNEKIYNRWSSFSEYLFVKIFFSIFSQF